MNKISTDRKIVFLMIFTIMAPFSHALLRGYFPEERGFICFLIAAVLCFLTHLFASCINNFIAGNNKVEYDKEKLIKEYINKKKLFFDILIAIVVAAIYLFAAFAMKKWYLDITEHRTIADSKGYVYEIFYAIFGFIITLFDEITWFMPDEIFMPDEPSILYFFIPTIIIVIITPVIFSGEMWTSLIYLAVYCILLFIRGAKRNRRNKGNANS